VCPSVKIRTVRGTNNNTENVIFFLINYIFKITIFEMTITKCFLFF
jgi:hypothetical protein